MMVGSGSFGETWASRISVVNGERKSRLSSLGVLPSTLWTIASMRHSRSTTRRSWQQQRSAEEVLPQWIGEESPPAVSGFGGPTELYMSTGPIPHTALAELMEQGGRHHDDSACCSGGGGTDRGERRRRLEELDHASLHTTRKTALPCCQDSDERIVCEPWLMSFPQTVPKMWTGFPIRAWAERTSTKSRREVWSPVRTIACRTQKRSRGVEGLGGTLRRPSQIRLERRQERKVLRCVIARRRVCVEQITYRCMGITCVFYRQRRRRVRAQFPPMMIDGTHRFKSLDCQPLGGLRGL
ncbi:hypothetical protein Taro_003327 [Colocasia esculenta]|uniref:Uncharacterized protein n=1 Tax=Colocasia esculenta TaxID=4460 RepID=A0A843TNR0_COLES|nr:hypothetical protein [Colocasia esculenta]